MSFPCTWQGCDKTFRTASLLDKHERTRKDRLRCVVCGKTYARTDVLSRHMAQAHGSAPASAGRPRRTPCTNCVTKRVACGGKPPAACQPCSDADEMCQYDGPLQSSGSPSRNGDAGFIDQAAPSEAGPSDWPDGSFAPLAMSDAFQPSVPMAPAPAPIFTGTDPVLELPTIDNDWLRILGLNPLMMPDPGWTLPEPEQDLSWLLNTHAPTTPLFSFPAARTMGAVISPSQMAEQSPESVHGVPPEFRDNQPDNSPWPHIDRPRVADVSVSLPRTEADASFAFPDSLSDECRQSMVSIISRSHTAIWPDVDTTNFPSPRTLTVCINLYYRHFHTWLPIMEERNELDESAPLLLAAMAAIGATYSRYDWQGLGIALGELVRRAVVYIRENDRRFMFEAKIVQAHLLQTFAAFYSGSPRAFHQAELSRGALVVACKRMHLLRPGLSAVQELRSAIPNPDPAELARREKEDRSRTILGWCIYLLDSQLACLLNLPAQLSIGEIDSVMPSSNKQPDGPTFTEVLDGLLSRGVISAQLDDLGLSIVAYTLYRMCIDAAAVQSILPFTPGTVPYALSFPPHVKNHPQTLLGRISANTLNSSLPPTPLLMSCAALAHHSLLQFAFPGFLQKVKIAAGKSGTLDSRLTARQTLAWWLDADRVGARRIFAHAAMLACLLSRYTFDTPPEVVWLTDAALSLWAVLHLSSEPISAGPSQTTISCFETTDIEMWIQQGGGISVQGMGDASHMTAHHVLQHMAIRLETLSWGLGKQYRQILLNLMTA